jgi:hypothetical protein
MGTEKVGIELGVETGAFVSGMAAAERSVDSLGRHIKKAREEEDWDKYSRLSIQRDSLRAGASTFNQDIQKLFGDPRHLATTSGGAAVIKMDQDTASQFKELTKTLKELGAKYDEQIKNNDHAAADETFSLIRQKQGEFHNMTEAAAAPTGIQAMAGIMKAVGINQIAGAINDGFSRWAGSLDRSGIVNQYGSGDIWGGRIAEKRRQADLAGGLAQGGLGIAGGIVGSVIPGIGTMAGAAGGAILGKLIDSVLRIGPNNEATQASYAELWQSKSGQAMALAANMGDPNAARDVYRTAARTAARYGYSAEEGMEVMKEAARQGLGGKEAASVAGRVFDYERRTGADRGTLTGISAMSARYGAGDALKAGWAGLQASGMSAGQYNEYLRAMQRVMEEGVSKGFVRSSEQVAGNLAMLSQMTGNDPLWQGENAARRLSEMSAGLEGATALSSTSDIIAFRAARNIAGGGSFIEAMKVLEGGLTPELFGEYMKLAGAAEGGSREGIVPRMRQTFNLSYTNADVLYKAWDKNKNITTGELKKLMESFKQEPPPADNPDLWAAITIEEIKNWWTETGISKWDAGFPDMLLEELSKAIREYNKETGSNVPVPSGGAPVPGVLPGAGTVKDAEAAFGAAEADPSASESAKRIARNNVAEATVLELDMRDSVKTATGRMYDEVFGSKEDKNAFRTVNSIFTTALSSDDPGERDSAVVFGRMLQSMTETEKGAIKRHNKDDDWNILGSATDIHRLIAALLELASKMDDITITTVDQP